jgi:calcineurin-like phosphoesterase family protein
MSHVLRSCLLVADLHLNDNQLDDYRWGIFQWLRDKIKEHEVDSLFILGDLTDSKDRHTAKLVNKLIGELIEFSCRVVIVMGNHDYIDPASPFFGFVRQWERVYYYAESCLAKVNTERVLLLPHTATPQTDWQRWIDGEPVAEVALGHLTVKGALGDNGIALNGIPRSLVRKLKMPVFSGDVHVAQTVANVEYIGAPYDIKFGDRSTRSAILFDRNGNRHDLKFPAPRKRILQVKDADDLAVAKVRQGDMVQVRVSLPPDKIDYVHELRGAIDQFVASRQLHLVETQLVLEFPVAEAEALASPDVGTEAAFDSYCQSVGLSKELIDFGRGCLTRAIRNSQVG